MNHLKINLFFKLLLICSFYVQSLSFSITQANTKKILININRDLFLHYQILKLHLSYLKMLWFS